jgi:hypothetical protein
MQMYVGSPRGRERAPGDPQVKATDLPAPSNPEVRLNAAGGELVAVRYFDGSITPQTAEANRQQLIRALENGEFWGALQLLLGPVPWGWYDREEEGAGRGRGRERGAGGAGVVVVVEGEGLAL